MPPNRPPTQAGVHPFAQGSRDLCRARPTRFLTAPAGPRGLRPQPYADGEGDRRYDVCRASCGLQRRAPQGRQPLPARGLTATARCCCRASAVPVIPRRRHKPWPARRRRRHTAAWGRLRAGAGPPAGRRSAGHDAAECRANGARQHGFQRLGRHRLGLMRTIGKTQADQASRRRQWRVHAVACSSTALYLPEGCGRPTWQLS